MEVTSEPNATDDDLGHPRRDHREFGTSRSTRVWKCPTREQRDFTASASASASTSTSA